MITVCVSLVYYNLNTLNWHTSPHRLRTFSLSGYHRIITHTNLSKSCTYRTTESGLCRDYEMDINVYDKVKVHVSNALCC